METGKKIRKYREKRGMTQKELGLLCGFSENTAAVRIHKYESGAKNPQHHTLIQMAHALDVDIVQLRGLYIGSETWAEELLNDIVYEYGQEFIKTYIKGEKIEEGSWTKQKERFDEEMFLKSLVNDIITVNYGTGKVHKVVSLDKVLEYLKYKF